MRLCVHDKKEKKKDTGGEMVVIATNNCAGESEA